MPLLLAIKLQTQFSDSFASIPLQFLKEKDKERMKPSIFQCYKSCSQITRAVFFWGQVLDINEKKNKMKCSVAFISNSDF